MKKAVMVSIDEKIHSKAKKLRLNVSRICEDALIKKLNEEPSNAK